MIACVGFWAAAIGFGLASTTTDFSRLAGLHALSGMAVGAALSVTHGTVARSEHPHRLFAWLGVALGIFAVLFLATTPPFVAATGGATLFKVFAGVMFVGALAAGLAFPGLSKAPRSPERPAHARIPTSVWFGNAGVACMAFVQAMTFSFLERVGADHGFAAHAITGVLVALGLVNLLPAAAAGLLERRWSPRTVMLCGPVLQALLTTVIMSSPAFVPYAMAASVFAAVMIFTHTFAFGLLARLDASGRALAATPAMVMAGSAVGPLAGGLLVKSFGYESIGFVALGMAVVAVAAFSRLPRPHSLATKSVAGPEPEAS
jgi:predicted MFS family arabinose efflux permease